MKKALIVLVLLGFSCGAAYADSLVFSPGSQVAPVSTQAMFTVTNIDLIPGTLEFIDFSWSVVSGPDMGSGISFFTTCFLQCEFDLSIQNNGMSGTDTIQATTSSLSNGTVGTASGTITWTAASNVPEPASMPLLATGLVALFFVSRRRTALRKQEPRP